MNTCDPRLSETIPSSNAEWVSTWGGMPSANKREKQKFSGKTNSLGWSNFLFKVGTGSQDYVVSYYFVSLIIGINIGVFNYNRQSMNAAHDILKFSSVNKKKINNELTCSQPVTMNIFKYSQFCNKIINQTETQSFSFITVVFCCLFMSLDLSKIILEFASNFGCLMSFLISSIPT